MLAASALSAAIALAGCASPKVDAQWADPQVTGTPLAGQRVLLACEAVEEVISRLCTDRLAAALQERGATVVRAADGARDDARYVAQAREAGASSVWISSAGPDGMAPPQRSSGVSIGLGGFSFGRGGGVGVGVSVPVGGGGASAQYAAGARVIDTASGKLRWTARAGAAEGGDAAGQLDGLLTRLVDAAAEARLF